ncbi:MipA/OmpV family protein [Pseudoalteromonas sp. T1lg65]|uniref:MipA/OmpV family protein n=1 Tax=Pseudoalteromonas sp. T1lg65 TaxID=2077101 RepID=UPI003F7AC392
MFKSLLVSTLALTSTAVLAEPQNNDELSWGIGLAVISQDQGYIDIGNETTFVPALAIKKGNFSLLGPRVSYKLVEAENYEVALSGHLRLDGYEADDADFFKGMEDRDMSFDLGFEVEYDTDFGEFGFEFMHDVTSTHEGYEASISYGIPVRYEDGRVVPYISANFSSEDLVDYYYGVKANEALANRPFYEGESTTNIEVGVSSDWFFGKHHMVKADISYTSYGSDIKDSPLIDKSGSLQIILGYVYVF